MTTIKELADHLKISVSTVSKALNNYDDVSEETRERVFKAAEELGYFPSITAQNLRRQTTNKIGFALYSGYESDQYQYVSDFYFEVMRGASNEAESKDYNLVLYTSIAPQPDRILRICKSHEIDGMILMAGGVDLSAPTEMLLSQRMPFVVLHEHIQQPGVSSVVPDNVGGGVLATRHLIELGHQRIAYLGRVDKDTENQARFEGYTRALNEFGMAIDQQFIRHVSLDEQDIRQAVEELVNLPERPTAIFAFNDRRAIHAMQVIADLDLQMPGDVAVVGFDDVYAALSTNPPLTTVRQPRFKMGARAAEILISQLISGNLSSVHEVLPVELVVRDSTVS